MERFDGICPLCRADGLKSTVSDAGSATTLLGFSSFFDEQGAHHNHDPNCRNRQYRCSRGHEFKVREVPVCTCGWRGLEECKTGNCRGAVAMVRVKA